MSTRASRSSKAATRTRDRSAMRERPVAQGAPSLIERLLRPRLMVVVVAIVAAVLLYGPARTYYAATRDASAYEQQLAAIEAHNEQLRQEVEQLQTREGIEDAARRHGYVALGETAVKVAGLPDEEPDISTVTNQVSPREAEPWYLHVLDFVFNYEPVRTAG